MTRPLNPGQRATAKAMLEAGLEAAIASKCKSLDLLYYHTYRSDRSPSGYPDDHIVGPAGDVYVENKRVGKKPTASQQEWLDALSALGYEVHVWTPEHLFDGTIDAVLLRLSGRRKAL